MKISLVASPNGLGHARRLLNLILGFSGRGKSLLLFMTPKQATYLKSEITEIMKIVPFKVSLIGRHSIDGSHFRNLPDFEEVSKENRVSVAESDIVLSDNSLWPAQYSDNFFLFGHFSWITFYESMSKFVELSPFILERLENEAKLLQNCRARFSTTGFSFRDSLNLLTIEVPLLRYRSDSKVLGVRGEKIWLSSGTTNENTPDSLAIYEGIGELQPSETWQLSTSREMPLFVMGRPGLGSIRDCLAHRTFFHPLWSGIDVELTNNSSYLQQLGFTVDIFQEPSKLRAEIEKVEIRIGDFWAEKSANPATVVDLIFSSIV